MAEVPPLAGALAAPLDERLRVEPLDEDAPAPPDDAAGALAVVDVVMVEVVFVVA